MTRRPDRGSANGRTRLRMPQQAWNIVVAGRAAVAGLPLPCLCRRARRIGWPEPSTAGRAVVAGRGAVAGLAVAVRVPPCPARCIVRPEPSTGGRAVVAGRAAVAWLPLACLCRRAPQVHRPAGAFNGRACRPGRLRGRRRACRCRPCDAPPPGASSGRGLQRPGVPSWPVVWPSPVCRAAIPASRSAAPGLPAGP